MASGRWLMRSASDAGADAAATFSMDGGYIWSQAIDHRRPRRWGMELEVGNRDRSRVQGGKAVVEFGNGGGSVECGRS
jgi:hypothetical protein